MICCSCVRPRVRPLLSAPSCVHAMLLRCALLLARCDIPFLAPVRALLRMLHPLLLPCVLCCVHALLLQRAFSAAPGCARTSVTCYLRACEQLAMLPH